jgi:ABC-type transport system involved in multi-copper enzyme maturation permease subunit
MLASLGAELLKIRRRPSTWVLPLIWLAIIVLLNYTLVYVLLTNVPPPTFPEGTPKQQQEQLKAQQEQFQEQQLRSLYPENLVRNLIPGYPSVGAPIALILGALVVGSEYGWATFKTILTQRPGRTALFLGKLLCLGVILALLVALTFATSAASSLVVAALAGGPLKGPPLGDLLRALGAGYLVLAVWASLGALLSTLLRSTALSVGLGLVYSLVLETVIFNLPINSESFTNARRFFPGQNSSSLADSFSTQPPTGFAPQTLPIDATQSTLVLLAYTATFIILATVIFRRRDVS